MLRRLGTKIADAIDFLLDLWNWWDGRPTSEDFQKKMTPPELGTPKPKLPHD